MIVSHEDVAVSVRMGACHRLAAAAKAVHHAQLTQFKHSRPSVVGEHPALHALEIPFNLRSALLCKIGRNSLVRNS